MNKISRSVCLLISCALAICITFIDVILNINFIQIGDRVNYVALANNIESYIDIVSSQPSLFVLRDEPVWSLLFFFLDWIGLSNIATVRVTIFISSIITFFVMIDKGRIPLYAFIFLFFFDWFIGNYVNALRMGFASSIFLFGWFYANGKQQKLIWAFTPFIHYSFFIILGILFLESFFKKRRLSADISVIITALIGLFFGLFVFIIATFLGFGELSERYSDFEGWISVSLGPIFFSCILIIFLLQDNNFKQKNLFSIMILTFYISCVIIFPPISRILISTIVLILISGFSIKSYYKLLFIILIFMYSSYFTFSGKLTELLFNNF